MMSASTLKAIRPDIQALRAIAVLFVIAFHLYPNRLTGGFIGVDIFFVISGFLITSHIAKDIYSGSFSVTAFWARRIRRLLPAAFLVLSVTLVAIYFLAHLSDQPSWYRQVFSSTLYFQNWELANSAVDYLATQTNPSPVQHFWSLSVEEQFYIAWPLILVLVTASAAINYRNLRTRMFAMLALIFFMSLGYSVFLSLNNPAVAYFSTFTRAWEFCAGAILALCHSSLFARMKPKIRPVIAGISMIALIFDAFIFSTKSLFPSWTALAVVIPTCALIGVHCESGLIDKAFRLRLIQTLGDSSYSAYLWHWPLIVFVPIMTAHPLRTSDKAAIVILTLVLAVFCRKYVELPFIHSDKGTSATNRMPKKRFVYANATILAVTLSLISHTASSGAFELINRKLNDSQNATDQFNAPCFGANARLSDGQLCSNPALGKKLFPEPSVAEKDNSSVDFTYCLSNNLNESTLKVCKIGDPQGQFKVLLVGDSHAAQFRGPIGLLAKTRGWQLETLTKGACALNYSMRVANSVQMGACRTWVNRVVSHINQAKYDLVVTTAASRVVYVSDENPSAINPTLGFVSLWKQILKSGARILVIKDSPRPIADVNSCVSAHLEDPNALCSIARKSALSESALVPAVRQMKTKKVQLLNLDNIYCGIEVCEPVIGNVLVYRDSNYATNSFHLTNTFAKTLAPVLARAIEKMTK